MLSDRDFLFATSYTHILTDVVSLENIVSNEVVFYSGNPLDTNISKDGAVSFHTESGRSAKIILADQLTRGGIVHVVDAILHPEP